MAFFELVNTSSGNRVGNYPTREEALLDVRAVIDRRGPDAVATIALGYAQDDGDGYVIAEGDELVELASHAGAVPA